MADTPPDDEKTPDDADSLFLTTLWDLLERAMDVSTAIDVHQRLGEILQLCEEAVALLRRGPA